MIFSLLLRLGLSDRLAKLIAYVAIPIALLMGIYFAVTAYGNGRYNAGVAATDAKWKAASDAALKKAAAGTAAADKNELPRVVDFTAKVEQEKAKLDAVQKDGSSPFDVLFPAGNSM